MSFQYFYIIRGWIYKSIYFLFYDYYAADVNIDSRFDHKLWSLYNRKNTTISSSLL